MHSSGLKVQQLNILTNILLMKVFALTHVVQVLEEFQNIFGPDLKAITGDPKQIEEALCRVDELHRPIEEITFNPFNKCRMGSWKMIMHNFNNSVQVC